MKKNKKLIPFTKNACSISDDWTYKDMKVVWLENDYLKIGILVEIGRASCRERV